MKNYPTKRYIRIGKSYIDYLRLEIGKGNITEVEFKFWKKQNEELKDKLSGLPTYSHDRGNVKKLIPYNA